jgi:hypothetical protein
MKIGDGKDKNFILANLVNDAIRETPCAAASRARGQSVPCFWILSDSIKGFYNFGHKSIAQAGGFIAIVFNSLIKF